MGRLRIWGFEDSFSALTHVRKVEGGTIRVVDTGTVGLALSGSGFEATAMD